MAFVYGIGFLVIFLLELVLAIAWIKKFQLYTCCSKYGLSTYIVTCYLIILPLGSGLDNLQKLFGSFLSESLMESNAAKNFFIVVSFLHFVLLTFLVIICAFFLTKPKANDPTMINIQNDEDPYHDALYTTENQSSSSNVCNICIWIFAVVINIALAAVGVYSWVTLSIGNNEFRREFTIWEWGVKDDIELNTIQIIGEQIPSITCILVLIMNGIIWKRYKYGVPFVWTLVSIVCIFALVTFWPTGFFFAGNLFEWTLYVGFYKLEVFMYCVADNKLNRNKSYDYYEMKL